MRRGFKLPKLPVGFLIVVMFLGTRGLAGVVAVGPGAFPPGSTLIDFNSVAIGTEINGLNLNGVLFSYLVGGTPLLGAAIIDGGPGVTNNINPPNVVSIGNNTGILRLTLSSAVNEIGYGYALLASTPVSNATTMSIFSGSTPLGSLSYNGVPDPTFTGGFAGLQSTSLFDRVDITFNLAAAPAFALDNVRLATVLESTVPEPATTLLVPAGVLFLYWRRRTKK